MSEREHERREGRAMKHELIVEVGHAGKKHEAGREHDGGLKHAMEHLHHHMHEDHPHEHRGKRHK